MNNFTTLYHLLVKKETLLGHMLHDFVGDDKRQHFGRMISLKKRGGIDLKRDEANQAMNSFRSAY